MKPILIIHGGAGSRVPDPKRRELLARSLKNILDDAYPVLARSGSALDAVIRAVELLEDDPLYNAGRGSKIQSDERIRMSASLMDGASRRFSGCVNVERVKNPIRLSEELQDHESRVLSETGAARFARERGLAFASPFTDERKKEFREGKRGRSGTVGAVALDSQGRLAAATSTGGRGFEYPHRVSDTPTVAGNYANSKCAVSATGMGEHIVDFAAAASLCACVEAGLSLEQASRAMLRRMKRAKASFGWIALDARGRIDASTSTEHLIWALGTREGFRLHP